MNKHVVIGSLIGTVAVQLAFLACSSPPTGTGMDAGVNDAGSIRDAMQIRDAMAQDGGGTGCPSCLVRTATADTDATRLVRGTTGGSGTGAVIVDGPFVLTDLIVSNTGGGGGNIELWMVPTGTACGTEPGVFAPNELMALPYGTVFPQFHGARYLVSAGQSLCYRGASFTMHWAGFRPYEG